MDIFSSSNLYGWLTSLLRLRGTKRKLSDDAETLSPTNVEIEFSSSTQFSLSTGNLTLSQNEISENSISEENRNRQETQQSERLNINEVTYVFKGAERSKMDTNDRKENQNEETSIEEDIEEVISEDDGNTANSDISDVKSKENLGSANEKKKHELFGIIDKDDDKDENEGSNVFKIDDDQLSGERLMQHFLQKDEKASVLSEETGSKIEKLSRIDNDKFFENASSSKRSDKEKNQIQDGNDNQNTINDVSEFDEELNTSIPDGSNGSSVINNEESSKNDPPLYTRSCIEYCTTSLSDDVNFEKRNCKSLEMAVNFYELPKNIPREDSEEKTPNGSSNNSELDIPNNTEQDNSIDELIESNHSIRNSSEKETSHQNVSSNENILKEKSLTPVAESVRSTNEPERNEQINIPIEESSLEGHKIEADMKELKEKISSFQLTPQLTGGPHLVRGISFEQTEDQVINIKQMERVQNGDFSKDILEDITEESEKNSTLHEEKSDMKHISEESDSVISLNMIQMLEKQVHDLQDVIETKNVCIESLNMQLDAAQRRESFANTENRDSLKDFTPSGRESTSIATTSTEYRPLQEECGAKIFDFHGEIAQRDLMIKILTESLEKSLEIREKSEQTNKKLAQEVQQLRKQFEVEDLDTMKRPFWGRGVDQESTGQRLSEISCDLVSESDDDLDRNFLTDNEDKMSTSNRNSRERRLSETSLHTFDFYDQPLPQPEGFNAVSKQIEQFKKNLNAEEYRIFFMVEKKFDDFLSQEVEKTKIRYENEMKVLTEQLESEKHEKITEINRLKQEIEGKHAKEMEELRSYFEKKCADMEKHYSEEIFSQKSQRNLSHETSSDLSDQDNLPEEDGETSVREPSPRKRTREELYSSPIHRQITPTTLADDFVEDRQERRRSSEPQEREPQLTKDEIDTFYRDKIREITKTHEEVLKKLNEKLKRLESKYSDDEFMKQQEENQQKSIEDKENENSKKESKKIHKNVIEIGTNTDSSVYFDDKFLAGIHNNNKKEKEVNEETHEISEIVAEYQRQLKEQVALAKEDAIRELEMQIQAFLSENTTDDQHWPPELILIREKFTAQSQLEIAQLQKKHEEEMSRLRENIEKQLLRKLKRNSMFDLSRDLDQVVNERENFRELSSTFRWLLSELVKFISVYENDLSATITEELIALNLSTNTNLEDSFNNSEDNNIDDNNDNDDENRSPCKQLNLSVQSGLSIELAGGDATGLSLNNSRIQTVAKRLQQCAPNVSGILSLIEDPSLVEFVAAHSNNNFNRTERHSISSSVSSAFNLRDCLEKLKLEANYLLKLSEEICQKRKETALLLNKSVEGNSNDNKDGYEKNDSSEEEDGLRRAINRSPQKPIRANSLNDSLLLDNRNHRQQLNQLQYQNQRNVLSSLPPDLNRFHFCTESIFDDENNESDGQAPFYGSTSGTGSELNFQVNELRNRLVKSESDRLKLQQELEATIRRNTELGQELNGLREQLIQLDSQREDYTEGFALGDTKTTPPRVSRNSVVSTAKKTNSFIDLQEKARNILNTPPKMSENTSVLLQMIEEFCREGDKVFEDSKKDREDLQAQIDAADKQLKATRQFLDEQATERELERDEFLKEIEILRNQIREKEKERNSYEIASKELTKVVRMGKKIEQMEQQVRDLTQQIVSLEAKKEKLEGDLKASIDKVFDLREIITGLEYQVETKTLSEQVLMQKVKELEVYLTSQNHSNETLQQEIESLRSEISQSYEEKISQLEEQLKQSRTSAEQVHILGQITEQLRDIEKILDQKIKVLENLHHSVSSISCSTSPIEDVSVQATTTKTSKRSSLPRDSSVELAGRRASKEEARNDDAEKQPDSTEKQELKSAVLLSSSNSTPKGSPVHVPPNHSLPIEEMQKVLEKLAKHTRVEEAALKRIRDLEMQMETMKTSFMELQTERDILQERMSEQLLRISSLQSKLEEQRRRAEELQRQGTSDLNIRIHDLQNELVNVKETLSARDKQINNLKNQLEQSKVIIDRQETELAFGIQDDPSTLTKLEAELKLKTEENAKLKDKIKKEMISKIALPDLMETMLADKNEEIDHLKEQLKSKEKELQGILEIQLSQEKSSNSHSNSNENGAKSKDAVVAGADADAKLSARTLSDIVSIEEYDEPEAIRRAPIEETPVSVADNLRPHPAMGKTIDSTAEEKRSTPMFTSMPRPQLINTFNANPYFQESSGHTTGTTPSFAPRQINFSDFVQSTPKIQEIPDRDEFTFLKSQLSVAENNLESLKLHLESLENEKNLEIEKLTCDLKEKTEMYEQVLEEKRLLEEKLEKLQELDVLKEELQQTRAQLDTCSTELEARNDEIDNLRGTIIKLSVENDSLSEDSEEIRNLKDEITTLTDLIKEKDELISKHEKNIFNLEETEKSYINRISELENLLQNERNSAERGDSLLQKEFESLRNELNLSRAELNSVKADLTAKVLLHEKSLMNVKSLEKEIERCGDIIKDKDNVISSLKSDSQSLKEIISTIQQKLDGVDSLSELRRMYKQELDKVANLEKRNLALETELEKLKSQSSDNSSKPYSLDEIAAQVEKELNYSVQLDSNILKAIESEEENNLDTPVKTDNEKLIEQELRNQVELLIAELDKEKRNLAETQELLNQEKLRAKDVQTQDAQIIEAMRIRLEDAIKTEQELHLLLDEEREKCNRLATQVSVLQRAEARMSSLLLKSPPDSPRKSPRSSDFESDIAERLKSEIKLLNAQNEREKERVTDLQKVLEREKNRFQTELNDRIEYGEKLKYEMERLIRDKDQAEQETEHLQERLTLASREIESLENRISTLQEGETRRAQRRERERTESTRAALDLQELKSKLTNLETERDHLTETVANLRSDIERGAQREIKLTEALANYSGDASIPQQFLQKMKEMNDLLAENTKENHQLSDTLQFLVEERKILQRKCDKLEEELSSQNYAELEDKANHLFGRYLRVESHRKALVHQKRYLLISLKAYEETENKTMTMLNRNVRINQPKRNLFKTVALMAIAIQRMKFIVKRWQHSKRIISKSIFTIPINNKKSAPATVTTSSSPTSSSPPCRDINIQPPPAPFVQHQQQSQQYVNQQARGFSLMDNNNNTGNTFRGFSLVENPTQTGTALQAPGLIYECSQKFDWSRLKKS